MFVFVTFFVTFANLFVTLSSTFFAYNFQFLDISHSGQHAGFFEPHWHSRDHRLDSEPTSRFSQASEYSYCALEEEFKRTVAKLGAVERDLDIRKCV